MESVTIKAKANAVGAFAAGKIDRLQACLLGIAPGASAARAALARLRRLGTAADGGWMLVGDQLFESWPEDKLGQPMRGDKPTRELLAVQAVLRLYGLHQQSQKSPMAMNGHDVGHAGYNGSFGRACRRIEPDRESSGGVQRHLACIESAVDFDSALYQIQGLVLRLKNEGIPLDYYVLAEDLYLLQFDALRGAVLARWAKDFHLFHLAEEDAEKQSVAQ